MIWGIDSETGQFKLLGDQSHQTQDNNRATKMMPHLWSSRPNVITPSSNIPIKQEQEYHNNGKKTIVELIHDDIEHLLTELVGEEEKFRRVYLAEKAKTARLLFLFQKDLMPGLQGMILESKERRDQVVVKGVSRSAKILAWLLLALLDGGMLCYIFLFAFSQTTHRQSAWAQSFVLWLVTEIFLVSTVMVCLTNILLPFFVMKDVTRIQSKLMDSVMGYYQNLGAGQDTKKNLMYIDNNIVTEKEEGYTSTGGEEKNIGETEKGKKLQGRKKKPFNAAEYLFLSFRLAKVYPDLKVSKIITQFSTPWPRQSYQHVKDDVAQSYSSRFQSLSRSLSIVALFFVSNLIAVPVNLQDMICQLISTTMIGYTMLLHMQLFAIFPVLVIVPTAFIALVVHFIIRANARNAEIAQQLFLRPQQNREQEEQANKDDVQSQDSPIVAADQNFEEAIYPMAQIEETSTLTNPTQQQHVNRRQSVAQAITLVQHVQHQLHSPSTTTALATSPFAFNQLEHIPLQEHDGGYEGEKTTRSDENSSDEHSIDCSLSSSEPGDEYLHMPSVTEQLKQQQIDGRQTNNDDKEDGDSLETDAEKEDEDEEDLYDLDDDSDYDYA